MTATEPKKNSESKIEVYQRPDTLSPFDVDITPQAARAIQAIQTGIIPKEQISAHPGKGGKVFRYVKHPHATQLMNDSFGMAWDWEVTSPQVFDDGSAMTLGRMTLNVPYVDSHGMQQVHKRVIQEVGAFDPAPGNPMPKAMRIGSAASRALLKCMFRAFGFGKELYDLKDEEPSPDAAWNVLWNQAKNAKITDPTKRFKDAKELMAFYKEKGYFKSANKEENQQEIVNKFQELYFALAEEIKIRKGYEQFPS